MAVSVVRLAGGYQTLVPTGVTLSSSVLKAASPYKAPSQSSYSGAAQSSGGDTYNTTSYPSFPRAPRAPKAQTMPEPDDRRIKVAEERALARRKRGRFSTILSDRPGNKLN